MRAMGPFLGVLMRGVIEARDECHDDEMREHLTSAFDGLDRAAARLEDIVREVQAAGE